MNKQILGCPCRLCDGPSHWIFDRLVLGRHQVGYYRCENCLSLQTENPYWLDEAYERTLAVSDTGAAQRTITNFFIAYICCKFLGLKNVVDFGGGDGFLCRLLRDRSINCYVKDKHAAPLYAAAFTSPDFNHSDAVLAFEVIEHFANPKTDMQTLFEGNPKLVCISTEMFDDQDSAWWYLSPDDGQHVFFFHRRALQQLARKYRYEIIAAGRYTLLLSAETFPRWRQMVLSILVIGAFRRLIGALALSLPAHGHWKDFDRLRHSKNYFSTHQATVQPPPEDSTL